MEQKDKLIEILQLAPRRYMSYDEYADYLLANGVIVPPCKVGDDIWWVDEEKDDIACEKGGIKAVVYNGKTFEVLTEAGVEPIGTKFCNLSREEAEAALKGVKDGEAD